MKLTIEDGGVDAQASIYDDTDVCLYRNTLSALYALLPHIEQHIFDEQTFKCNWLETLYDVQCQRKQDPTIEDDVFTRQVNYCLVRISRAKQLIALYTFICSEDSTIRLKYHLRKD